jgi:hypothetical protein
MYELQRRRDAQLRRRLGFDELGAGQALDLRGVALRDAADEEHQETTAARGAARR